MKHFLISLVLISNTLCAQVESFTAEHIAVYELLYFPFKDSKNKEKITMEVNIAKNVSYVHDPAITKIDSLINSISLSSQSPELLMMKYKSLEKPVYKSLIVKNNLGNTISHYDIIGKTAYHYVEKLGFQWKLISETKVVLGMKTFKATCKFKGRNYVAWYNPEIPISDGPYKFFGLPGLIVEIYDEFNTFKFTLNSFKTVKERQKRFYYLYSKSKLVTKKDFNLLKEKYNNNPLLSLQENPNIRMDEANQKKIIEAAKERGKREVNKIEIED